MRRVRELDEKTETNLCGESAKYEGAVQYSQQLVQLTLHKDWKRGDTGSWAPRHLTLCKQENKCM